MKFALLQPNWTFAGSTYFGCPDTHLPLELFYARQQLQAAGHEALLLDAHLENLSLEAAAARVRAFAPDFVVLTTAPTYLFWRCPQPELRLPAQWMRGLRQQAPRAVTVAIGPHGSSTPGAALAKLDCDVVVRGEPEQVLARLATTPWAEIEGIAYRENGAVRQNPGLHQTNLAALPALDFSGYPLPLRQHRHHVFSGSGRGAELEASRGCPWACNFCNKTLFRNRFRERPVATVAIEVESLLRAGFDYIYFIDEIFGCGRSTPALLEVLTARPIRFGVQTRMDLWNEASLAALGRAGCIALECGIESISPEGRERFRKGCRLGNDRLQALLRAARRHIPWVQANLIAAEHDDREAIAAWRADLIASGVWVSQPVPVFAFPGTPLYLQQFGPPDDQAWERAHRHYLEANRQRGRYSDLQDPQPLPLLALEALEVLGRSEGL
ncbi:MAG TPA: TIGR04295 family B12-binding domain-containing radical SAM protein [Terriglobales bacterium]|nr:TIGR04295 family B12-binding domain-containing radical SAM protein [Terriglobales bacterium]